MPATFPFLAYTRIPRGSVGSTNDEARALAKQGAAAGTLVIARTQDAGRGRRGRQWQSPPGNLYASLILRPTCPVSAAGQLSFVASVALAEAVERLVLNAGARPDCAPEVRCKWPNDVLVNGRKIAGLLLESDARGPHAVDWVILGLGLNVAHHPADVERPATSLAIESLGHPSLEAAEAAVFEAFAGRYAQWCQEGFAPIRQAWLDRAAGMGKSAAVRLQRETLEGVFRGLDSDGALLLEGVGGEVQRIAAGDLFFPPPPG